MASTARLLLLISTPRRVTARGRQLDLRYLLFMPALPEQSVKTIALGIDDPVREDAMGVRNVLVVCGFSQVRIVAWPTTANDCH